MLVYQSSVNCCLQIPSLCGEPRYLYEANKTSAYGCGGFNGNTGNQKILSMIKEKVIGKSLHGLIPSTWAEMMCVLHCSW